MSNTNPNANNSGGGRKKIFSEATLMPVSVILGVLVPLFCTGVIAVWVLRGEILNYTFALQSLDGRVAGVEKKIDNFEKRYSNIGWTYSMMRAFSAEAGIKNPNWIVPDYARIKEEQTPDLDN